MSAERSLRSDDLPVEPLELYARWRDEAIAAGEPEVDAVALATVDPDGRPAVRFVLVRGSDTLGLRIYTDRRSRKGRSLDATPVAALAIHWKSTERQVRVEGTVERCTDAESEAYWSRRPRDSQLSAWASTQSAEVANRDALEVARIAIASQFPEGTPIPRPEWWGGYLVRPRTWEFWQGRRGRAHDRFRYSFRGGAWVVARLAP